MQCHRECELYILTIEVAYELQALTLPAANMLYQGPHTNAPSQKKLQHVPLTDVPLVSPARLAGAVSS
jgi:hypothetical protein